MECESSLVVNALLGLMLTPRGPSYTLVRVLQGMTGSGLATRIFTPLDRWTADPLSIPTYAGRLSRLVDRRVPYKLVQPLLMRRAEQRLLQHVPSTPDNIVFTWGEVSLAITRAVHERGIPIVREKFNCAKPTAKAILDRHYKALGSAPNHSITNEMIDKEDEELRLAEAVFCPSPMVEKSLLEVGLPPERLLPTSYGWEPARFAGEDKALPEIDGPTLVFVGFVCVRKGAHILLEAWRRANIKGRLVLVGDIEPLIAERYKDVLAREDVVYVPFTTNIAAYYRSADWFIFPTLEEGGPQVTYEAAGNGLPVIVSPMGAGAFARDGLDGLIVDSEEPEVWSDVIASLPDRLEQRRELGEQARRHALEFTYDKVGARRRELLLKRFCSAPAPAEQRARASA